MCCPFRRGEHTAAVPPPQTAARTIYGRGWTRSRQGDGTWDRSGSIPVVTFLAPLASNFEGLKDR